MKGAARVHQDFHFADLLLPPRSASTVNTVPVQQIQRQCSNYGACAGEYTASAADMRCLCARNAPVQQKCSACAAHTVPVQQKCCACAVK